MVLRETFMILIKYVQMQKTVATRLLFLSLYHFIFLPTIEMPINESP